MNVINQEIVTRLHQSYIEVDTFSPSADVKDTTLIMTICVLHSKNFKDAPIRKNYHNSGLHLFIHKCQIKRKFYAQILIYDCLMQVIAYFI